VTLSTVRPPRNTPVEIIDKLNREIDAGVADSKMKARLADLGGIALTRGDLGGGAGGVNPNANKKIGKGQESPILRKSSVRAG